MAVVFTKHTPNLVVSDMPRSLAFYRDLLGFTAIATVPDAAPYAFVMLQRDKLELFLNSVDAVREERGTAPDVGTSGVTMYFDVKGVKALHDELKGKIALAAPLERKFYGVTEFGVKDPDGYLITFAERLD